MKTKTKQDLLQQLCSIEGIEDTSEAMWTNRKLRPSKLPKSYFQKPYYCNVYWGRDGYKEMCNKYEVEELLLDCLQRVYKDSYEVHVYDASTGKELGFEIQVELLDGQTH